MFGVRPFRGCRCGREKSAGQVSGTPQLGLQWEGAGHNLGTPRGDALIPSPNVRAVRHPSYSSYMLGEKGAARIRSDPPQIALRTLAEFSCAASYLRCRFHPSYATTRNVQWTDPNSRRTSSPPRTRSRPLYIVPPVRLHPWTDPKF